MKAFLNEILPDYELIDCGNGLKLERFADIVLIRPDVTAIAKPATDINHWRSIAHAEFVEIEKNKGHWKAYKTVPDTWQFSYQNSKVNVNAILSLTNSKHIGIFPEQVINWNYLSEVSTGFKNTNFLNLFGYTGLSSLAAANSFEKITHIDSIKKVVDWTKLNATNSAITNVRCITEDAQKFVEREIKRGNKYGGVILDPPPIGTGANNEKWILEEMIDALLLNISQILLEKSFIIMNLYSHSMNEKFIHRLILTYFSQYKIEFCDKVYGLSKTGNSIDHGFFVRLRKL